MRKSTVRRALSLALVLMQTLTLSPALALGERMEFDPILGLSWRSKSEDPGAGTVDVFSCLNIREGPGVSFPIIGKAYPGTPLKILGTENGWHRVAWEGRIAWCCAYYVHTKGEGWHNGALAGDGAQKPAGDEPAPGDDSASGAQRGKAGGPLLSMPLINQNTGGGRYPGSYCGPTTCRMVMAYYGINKGADEVALGRYGPGTPMYTPGNGSSWLGMSTALRHFGLKTNLTNSHSLSQLRQTVGKGHPVIVSIRGNYGAGFTTAGHITVVVGFTANGDPIINDSAGGKRRTVPAATFLRCWAGLFLEVSK